MGPNGRATMSNGYTIPKDFTEWQNLSAAQREFALWATLRENQDYIKSMASTQRNLVWQNRVLAVVGGFVGGATAVIAKFLTF